MKKNLSKDTVPADPDVPKKLAGRLRGVYLRVSRARSDIAHREAKNRDQQLALDEYEANPADYTALHSPRYPDPTDYPTVTRTDRLCDELDRAAARLEGYKQALPAAEADMVRAEAEVLAELQRLGRVTPGREPWPVRPATLPEMIKMWEREFASLRKKNAKDRREMAAKRERDAARREEERQKFATDLAELVRNRAATMPPGKAAAYLSMMAVLQEKHQSGDLNVTDIYDIAAGDSPKMQAMIEEAQSRAIDKLQGSDNAG